MIKENCIKFVIKKMCVFFSPYDFFKLDNDQ